MAFRKKRGDTKIGNIPDLADMFEGEYRRDMHLDTVLDHYGADSLTELRKILKENT